MARPSLKQRNVRVPKLKTVSTSRLGGQNPPASALRPRLTVGKNTIR